MFTPDESFDMALVQHAIVQGPYQFSSAYMAFLIGCSLFRTIIRLGINHTQLVRTRKALISWLDEGKLTPMEFMTILGPLDGADFTMANHALRIIVNNEEEGSPVTIRLDQQVARSPQLDRVINQIRTNLERELVAR